MSVELKSAVLGHTALSNRPQHHAQTAIITRLTRIISGPEEDHQLHHSCWTGRVSKQEEECPLNGLSFLFVFKCYPGTYCLMQGSCFICINF